MRIYLSYNLKLKIDLDGILDENSLEDGLVKSVYKFAKSVTKIGNKVQEPKIYNEAINNPIHRNI